MQFETIIGFSLAEATSIVSNDTWFADNVSNDDIQRYIKFETDATGKHITSIARSNNPAEGYIQVDKTIDVANIVTDTDGKLAAFLFSVNANKGPNNEVKKFFAVGGSVAGDTEKKFLGHVAWLTGNGGYGSDTDLLCQYEGFTRHYLPLLETTRGREIFASNLYTEFVKVVLAIQEPDTFVCPTDYSRLAAGLAQDLKLVNRFLWRTKNNKKRET